MKRCAEPRGLRQALIIALAVLMLVGCAGKKPKRPTTTTPTPPPATAERQTPDAPPAPKADPEARFAEALEMMKQNKVREAEAAFMELSKDFPEFSGPQTNLGILFAKSNRRDAAIAAFTRAATANGQNASAFNWLGIVNKESGNYDRARQSYEKAIAVKPDYAAAHLNLGLLLEDQLKQPAVALQHYKEYQRLTGGKDLRVLPWIAEIEARTQASAPAAAPAASPTSDAAEKELK